MNRFATVLILLIAAWARFAALAEDVRFHGDEALFATYARSAAVNGDWMLAGPLDKPPVGLYAAALSMQFTGVTTLADGVLTLDPRRGEWSARLPGAFAGLVTVALLMAAARHLGGPNAALFAGALAALSPHLVAFSATAFTDPLLLAFLVASLTTAISGRGAWSGLWLALAFATKQQAALYLPLVAAVLWVHIRRAGAKNRGAFRMFSPFAAALALGIVLLLVWDAARPDPSIFSYAADNNNPYRWLVPASEWLDRIRLWGLFAAEVFGAWPVTALVVVCAAAGGMNMTGKHRRDAADIIAKRSVFSLPRRLNLLFLFSLVYLIAHVVLPFNVYDRYLLLLVPPVILLAARALAQWVPHRAGPITAALVLALALTAPARFPSDMRDRDGGLIALADYINAQPLGTIVYNRWLGWEMGYYLGPWSDKRVVYYPAPEDFAADAPRNPDPASRLMIAPAWAPVVGWLDAARGAGFGVRIAHRTADYAAYWLDR